MIRRGAYHFSRVGRCLLPCQSLVSKQKDKTIMENNSVSDKRIYGASSSNDISETDEDDTCESVSTLRAVGQDAEGKAGGHSSATLTSPSGYGSSRESGARPKVGHGEGKGRRRKKKDDVWNNPTRKSAKSLKGQGQFLAATEASARGREDTATSSSHNTTAVRVVGAGSRGRQGPGSYHQPSRGKSGANNVALVRQLTVTISVLMIFFAISVYDLLTLEDTDTPSGLITGLGRSVILKLSVTSLMNLLLLLFLAVLAGAIPARNRTA